MVNASGISAFMDGTFLHGPTSHYALHCQPQMQYILFVFDGSAKL